MQTGDQHELVTAAMRAYWSDLDLAAERQRLRGGSDVGGLAAVTSGGHLDHVADLFAEVAIAAGAPSHAVHWRGNGGERGMTLPGHFRPDKKWDVVVRAADGSPIAVIELKSQTAPSFGNNANNRAEEAIGNAVDLWHTFTAGWRPWAGYVFVIEDAPRSRRSTSKRPIRGQDRVFDDWTYQDRVRILCERLHREGMYDAVWPVTTSRPPDFDWHELSPAHSYHRFAGELSLVVRESW